MTAANTDDRAAHRAVRGSIERDGAAAPRLFVQKFDEYNAEFFGGRLEVPLVLVMTPNSPRAEGDYCGRDAHGLRSRIRIRPNVASGCERYALDVLLHEMVHASCYEIISAFEQGYAGHGPVFARECNRIGAVLGLPPVGVKGRDGLPKCNQWPSNVRPEGYYNTKPKKPKDPKEPSGTKETVDLTAVRKAAEQIWHQHFRLAVYYGFESHVPPTLSALSIAYAELETLVPDLPVLGAAHTSIDDEGDVALVVVSRENPAQYWNGLIQTAPLRSTEQIDWSVSWTSTDNAFDVLSHLGYHELRIDELEWHPFTPAEMRLLGDPRESGD